MVMTVAAFVVTTGALPCASAAVAPMLASHPRLPLSLGPRMFMTREARAANSSDFGTHDLYGFEEFELPALPGGKRLSLRTYIGDSSEGAPAADEEDDDDVWASGAWSDEDASMWRRIEQYILTLDEDQSIGGEVVGVGGEVWPAAAFLCRWLANDAVDDVRGSRVLELGAGVGAVGIFSACLGASDVLLTDGGPPALLLLLQDNVARHRHMVPEGSALRCESLLWGSDAAAVRPSSEHAWDWVLASDVTYAGYAQEELARTLAILLHQSPDPPRVVIAHEHRDRDRPLGECLASWDEGDDRIKEFAAKVAHYGLRLSCLQSERPRCTERGSFRCWSHDLSIFEVLADGENSDAAP